MISFWSCQSFIQAKIQKSGIIGRAHNGALHRAAISLRSIAAGEFGR